MAEAAAEDFPELWAELVRRHPEEPYRRAFSIMRARTRAARKGLAGGYAGPRELLDDLHVAERALQSPQGRFVAAGGLRDLIRQVEVFGFHFARLDIREHAKIHRARDRGDPRRAAAARVLRHARRRRAGDAAGARDRRPAPADPRRRARALGLHAGDRRDVPDAARGARRRALRRGAGVRHLRHLVRGGHARGAAADEGVRAGRAGRRGRAAADRAAVRVRRDAASGPPTRCARCSPSGVYREALRGGRRRAGGDDRLLGLQQGRRLRRLRLGDLPRADRARRDARRARRGVDVLPRPRRRRRARRRQGQRRDPRPAARHRRRRG